MLVDASANDDGSVVLVDAVTLLLLVEAVEDTGHLRMPRGAVEPAHAVGVVGLDPSLLLRVLPRGQAPDSVDVDFLESSFFDLLDEASVGARRGIAC